MQAAGGAADVLLTGDLQGQPGYGQATTFGHCCSQQLCPSCRVEHGAVFPLTTRNRWDEARELGKAEG